MRTFLLLLAVTAALGVNLTAQGVAHRLLLRGRLVPSIALGFIAGLPVLLGAPLVASPATGSDTPALGFAGWTALIIALMLVYVAGSFVLVCLIAAGETSVRVQILRLLLASPQGLSEPELDANYSNRAIIGIRMDRLLASGSVVLRDGRYFVRSPALIVIAHLFLACRLVIYGRRSEFDSA